MATTDEAISLVSANLRAGIHFSEHGQLVAIEGSQILARDVAYRGGMRRVFIRDSGLRPPDPAGVWVDDLLSAACRHVFGASKGSCRKVQGTDHFEFREYWRDPTRYKVIENVTVEYAPEMKLPSEVIKVETSAYPGADTAAVVFASAYQLLERRFGGGGLHWVAGKDCLLHFEANPAAVANSLVPCHYTIVRNGGVSTELIVYVPGEAARNWDSLCLAISAECRRKFGQGSLGYLPELGECAFSWK